MRSASMNFAMSAKFSRPMRNSVSSSTGQIASPCAMPWVRDSEINPPFRPDAPKAMDFASSKTTLRDGSASRAEIAAQRPVRPPPIITRSALICPMSGEHIGGASWRSVQNGIGAASLNASLALDIIVLICSAPPLYRRARLGARWLHARRWLIRGR